MSAPRRVAVEARIAEELPGLGALELPAPVTDGELRSTPALRMRLDRFANEFRGPRAVGLRREPVTAAYRRAFRQVGLDPDLRPTPLERAALARMLDGGFLPGGLVADALLVALLDTGIPVWALDERALAGALVLRQSVPESMAAGRLVFADGRRPLVELFAEPPGEIAPARGCAAARLYSVTVPGGDCAPRRRGARSRRRDPRRRLMRAEILVFDGVEELDVVGPYEVLARAAASDPGSVVRLVSLEGPRAHQGQYGSVPRVRARSPPTPTC